MITTALFPGRYIQGYGAIQRLQKLIPCYGKKGFIISSPSVFEEIIPGIYPPIKEITPVVVEKFMRECSDEEITRLGTIASREACDVVVGLGGGKSIDTAKAVAHELDIPVIIAPTVASTDAPCSSLSVIYRSDTGRIKRVLVLRRNPDVVLVDTQIIANSPERLFVAGMGDALATWFEADSCRLKYAKTIAKGHGSMTAQTLARLCYEILLEYGFTAKMACRNHVVIPAFEHVVEANVLLSGIGFESAGLAAAHAIQDGLNALDKGHEYYHGEKVAFGVLVSLFMTDKPACMIDEVYSLCESVGLPTVLAELGMGSASDEDLAKVASIACAEKETIHNELIPITPELVIAAIKIADAEGNRRKKSNGG
ncbi:MAG: glycerol dehydrogenase [Deltaproteobacteria bacterium]|nr:glycerol dehydrogenase [Deltaproteobacteria bacterium]